MPGKRTAIVIGAGVVGIATSYALARRDWRVTLVDQEADAGMGASYANGAQLSYCYTDALASPALIGEIGPSLLTGEGLRVSPKFDKNFASWLAAFARNCTARKFRSNTLAVLELALESRAAMDRLLERHNIDFGHRTAGKLHLYFSEQEFAAAKLVRAMKAELGCEQICLSFGEALAAEPALEHLARSPRQPFVGAIHTPSEAVGDAYLFCRELITVLRENYAFNTRFETPVTAVDAAGQSAQVHLQSGEILTSDLTVICTGANAAVLLQPAGIAAKILPMKGYSFEMPSMPGSPIVSLTDTKRKTVFTNLGDRMRVAGFADLGNGDAAVDPQMIEQLVTAARRTLPYAGDYERATKHWAGLRPMTPNSQPIISRPRQSLAVNTGHGMLGWTMAMGSGERLAELVS